MHEKIRPFQPANGGASLVVLIQEHKKVRQTPDFTKFSQDKLITRYLNVFLFNVFLKDSIYVFLLFPGNDKKKTCLCHGRWIFLFYRFQ